MWVYEGSVFNTSHSFRLCKAAILFVSCRCSDPLSAQKVLKYTVLVTLIIAPWSKMKQALILHIFSSWQYLLSFWTLNVVASRVLGLCPAEYSIDPIDGVFDAMELSSRVLSVLFYVARLLCFSPPSDDRMEVFAFSYECSRLLKNHKSRTLTVRETVWPGAPERKRNLLHKRGWDQQGWRKEQNSTVSAPKRRQLTVKPQAGTVQLPDQICANYKTMLLFSSRCSFCSSLTSGLRHIF